MTIVDVDKAEAYALLAGEGSYDSLSGAQQAVVRAVWRQRMDDCRHGPSPAEEFGAAGLTWVEADEHGNMVNSNREGNAPGPPEDGRDPEESLTSETEGRAVWFLDVDGTLSPLIGDAPWSGAYLYPELTGTLAVPYDPEVVRQIGEMSADGLVEIRWLTTWDEGELEPWHDLGLGPFRVADGSATTGRGWWKARVVKHTMNAQPTARFVWTDDDIRPGHLRGLARDRLLAIRPKSSLGLTPAHLDQIADWVRRDDGAESSAR